MFEASVTLIIATVFLLGSPGPATLSLAAVGATVGFTRGLGYLYGILSGLIVVILGAGFGIAAVFSRLPRLAFVIQVAGGIYLLWIAYRIAAAPPLEEQSSTRQSVPSFTDGLILNLLNPKAYVAFFAVFSQFRLPFENAFLSFTSTGAICFALGVLVDILWLWVGDLMRLKFANPRSSRVIRIVFAIMIVVATGLAVTKMGAAWITSLRRMAAYWQATVMIGLSKRRPLVAERRQSIIQEFGALNDRFGEKRTIKREAQFRLRTSVLVTLAVTGTLGVTAMGLMTWAPFH